MEQYKYRDKIYTIIPCTNEDIPSHVEKVYQYWTDEELTSQLNRMRNAVQNNTAYKLVDENNTTKVFFYYEDLGKNKAFGITLWWDNLRIFCIFGMWLQLHAGIQEIYTQPLSSGSIDFKFLVEDYSIRGYHFNGTPLIVDFYSEKCHKLVEIYKKMDVERL